MGRGWEKDLYFIYIFSFLIHFKVTDAIDTGTAYDIDVHFSVEMASQDCETIFNVLSTVMEREIICRIYWRILLKCETCYRRIEGTEAISDD